MVLVYVSLSQVKEVGADVPVAHTGVVIDEVCGIDVKKKA